MVVVLLVILWWLLYPTQPPANNKEPIATVAKPALKPSLKARPATKPTDQQPASKTTNDTASVEAWLTEVANPIYSEDPVIEMASLNLEMHRCESIKHFHEERIQDDAIFAKRQQLIKDIKLECERMQSRYPQWFKAPLREKKLLSVTASSTAGQQYQTLMAAYFQTDGHLDFEQLTHDKNQLATRLRNAPMTSMAAMEQFYGFMAVDEFKGVLEQQLDTEDGVWIHVASEYALQKLSCSYPNSRSCEATSLYMWQKCAQDLSACGLDFLTWYQNHSSAGMRQDVEKLMVFFTEQATRGGP